MKKLILLIIVFSLIVSGNVFAKSENIRSTDIENAILNSVFEVGNSSIPMSIDPGDIVYEGIDATFNEMDLADCGTIGQSYNTTAYAGGQNISLRAMVDPPYTVENESWGYVGKEFIYSGSNRPASIYVKGSYKGMMKVVEMTAGVLPGSTSVSVSIVASVYDMETGEKAAQRTILTDSISSIYDIDYYNNNYFDSFTVYLKNGHAYKILLEASVEAEGVGVAQAEADFDTSDRVIKMVECGVTF